MTSLAELFDLLPIARLDMHETKSHPLALFVSGSVASYITHRFAHKVGPKCCRKVQMKVA